MKRLNIKIKLMLVSLLMLSSFFACKEDKDVMKIGVVDMNDKVTEFYNMKTNTIIAAPGDTILFKGTGLDQVYKVLLNEENVTVKFKATATELKMVVPSSAPLGNTVTVNLLFSGKGLAQRVVSLQSPPQILALVPAAAHADDVLTVMGKELYKTTKVLIGGVDVTSTFELIDDKAFTVTVPANFAGGSVVVETAAGSQSSSPSPLVVGTEILINNFDGKQNYYSSLGSNGNLDLDLEETGEFPRNKFWTFTFKDNATSWGGNVDFNTTGMPATYTDNTVISLSVDIKMSKALDVNVMIARGSDVWGKTLPLVAGWQTVVLKFSDMGSGYGSTIPLAMPLPLFSAITGVKIQPPVSASNGNFGETISVDNIKFIIAN